MPDAVELDELDVAEEHVEAVDAARGKSGSCSCHRTVVGVAMRSSGSVSASAEATIPDPARYHPTEAAIAPGAP